MTDFLPTLVWRPSPNFSSRRGARVDLIVLHDCEGGYEGSVRWFEMSRSSVSAHFVVREDGDEATQMVDLADNAWHACAFNGRSVGIEMGGFASRGFGAPLLTRAARISAYFCHYLQIPVRHARGGVGPGIASHHDLGAAGGGHHDPSDDPAFMETFVQMVDDERRKGHFPDVWEPRKQQKPCLLSPDGSNSVPISSMAPAAPDVHTIIGLQQALKMLGYCVTVDGDYGPETRQVVTSFQMHVGIVADGIAGAQTESRLLKELSDLRLRKVQTV
jgi:N-acetylmuramoyl-L-alanine amidase/Putative peptidoglycan binding domain